MHRPAKNTKPRVLIASSEYGTVDNMIGSMRLVSGVGARGLGAPPEVKTKCLGTRYAEITAFEKGDNATGVWHLEGSKANHKRYSEAAQANPAANHIEVMAIINSTFYEHCKRSDLELDGITRGES